MKYIGFIMSHSPEDSINNHNYFFNGSIKDDIAETGCVELFNTSKRRNLFAVFDASKSEIENADVAFLCADKLKDCTGLDFDAIYRNCFGELNELIKGRALQHIEKSVRVDTGILFFKNEFAKAYNIGDTKVFHFRNGVLNEISGDVPKTIEIEETVEDQEIEVKLVKKATAPYIGFMGSGCVVEPHISPQIKVADNDIFLITSQSITEVLSQEFISEILANDKLKIDEKAEAIVDAAVEKNPSGHYTIQIVYAKDAIRLFGIKLGYLIFAVVVASVIAVFSFLGGPINKSAVNIVEKWKYFVSSFTYRDIKPEVVADPWVPLGRESEEEKSEDAKDEENTDIDEKTEIDEETEPTAQNNNKQNVTSKPTIPKQNVTVTQQPKPSANPSEEKHNTPVYHEPQQPENPKPNLPPVEENTDVELPIDFN